MFAYNRDQQTTVQGPNGELSQFKKWSSGLQVDLLAKCSLCRSEYPRTHRKAVCVWGKQQLGSPDLGRWRQVDPWGSQGPGSLV